MNKPNHKRLAKANFLDHYQFRGNQKKKRNIITQKYKFTHAKQKSNKNRRKSIL